MPQQKYQPLSAALAAPPLVHPNHSPQPHYASYVNQIQPSTSNGARHSQREEEEEEEDDEEVVEEELDSRDQHSPSVQSPHPHKSTPASADAGSYGNQAQAARDEQDQATEDSKRKPGRPRGSRNRKPRTSTSAASKAPANSQHPGFYQYPPAPGAATQNQQFYEFQWRALNLCSEFYNAAEELIKAAPPMVIAQCYHSGPATKVDPLAMIADAKRVCDTLLANPSQLAGQPPPAPPAYPTVAGYGAMQPPPPPTTAAAAGTVINNPQSFVMPLGPGPIPPPGYAQPYYPAPYPPGPAARYPTAPYYTAPYYSAPAQAAPTNPPAHTPTPVPAPAPATSTSTSVPPPPASTSVPPPGVAAAPAPAPAPTPATPAPPTPAIPPIPAPASGLSAFNAATGNAAPGGTQGAWSEEETERLKRLAEQSRDNNMQNKGDIDWDWVSSVTQHQILLKATSLGLKESTTRGQKRRRENDTGTEHASRNPPLPSPATSHPAPPSGITYMPSASPAQSSTPSNPPSANASPVAQPMRPPTSVTPSSIMNPPQRTTPATKPAIPWPMPTLAANTPSPVMAHNQIDSSQTNYYNRHQTQTTQYGASMPPSNAAAAAFRPQSSHGNPTTTHHQHPYMYRPNGTDSSGRRPQALGQTNQFDSHGRLLLASSATAIQSASPSRKGIALADVYPEVCGLFLTRITPSGIFFNSEPVATATTSGPGLSVANGLPLPGSSVNQSAGTAQVQHHPAHHSSDPYASYAPYTSVVAYNTPYAHTANSSASTQYYIHTTSHAHPTQSEPHHAQHHESPHQSTGHPDTAAQQQNHHPLPEVNHQDHVQRSQPTYQTPQKSPIEPPSPSGINVTPNGAKRGPPVSTGSVEEQTPAAKKRKHRADNGNGEIPKDESDIGPSGGAKHWTDEEKTRLFQWMLTDDSRWEAFGSKMNTIFREGSAALFNSRKTFTALKSCYHRNLDVFRQIYAFEAFLAKSPTLPLEPPNASSPSSNSEGMSQQEMQEIADELLPSAFASPAQRQSFLERKLEAARNFNIPVGNLTIRVLDHWQTTGWYILFKRRFREDPQTGMPIPRHGALRHLDEHNASPDSRMDDEEEAGISSALHASQTTESLSDAQRRHLDSGDCLIPPPFPNQPIASRASGSVHRSQRNSPPPPSTAPSAPPFASGSPVETSSPHSTAFPYPPPPSHVSFYPPPPAPPGDFPTQQLYQQQQIHWKAQIAEALTHLTNTTQTLTELVRAQMEDTKVQTELMRKREERDEARASTSGSGNESQRAALATDMLSNPRAPDEIKKLAADYLKRLFQ
ncbi:hypothetical protein BC835DRAFT_1417656 [Cytidiella melzeri]|nr:hypothetical protein BC835DRAFT_1417656 [Cytidiella melzeri]